MKIQSTIAAVLSLLSLGSAFAANAASVTNTPNLVIILADELNTPQPRHVVHTWMGSWITSPGILGVEPAVVLFRRTIELAAKPEEFVINLTADNLYMLFVNGRKVCFGPQLSDLRHWRYETIDLAPFTVQSATVAPPDTKSQTGQIVDTVAAPGLSDASNTQKPGLTLSLESEQDISTLSTPGGPGHAATIVQTTSGAILAAWWSGPERAAETDIWMSRFNPDRGTWSAPYKAFDGDEVDKDYTCENCMLFQPKNGPLMLFVLVGGAAYKKPDDKNIYYHNLRGYLKTSSDDGRTWSAPKALGDSAAVEGGHLIGPTKNAPIQLADGTILVGSSTEYGLLESRNWGAITYHFEKSTDNGMTWQFVHKCAKAGDLAASHIMQPGFLRLGGSNLMVLGRDNTAARDGSAPVSSSSNNGQTWSTTTKLSSLKHNKAGICPLTLSDGMHVCLVNRYPGTSERDELDLMVSTDGIHWSFGINVQGTDGMDAHYPQAVQTADGKLHVVYSYGKHNQQGIIRHAIVRTGTCPGTARTPGSIAPTPQPPASGPATPAPAAKSMTPGALLDVIRSEDRSYVKKTGVSVNLTQDGTRDWLQCGVDADKKPVVVRKANVANRIIGEPYTVGQGTWRTYPKEPSTPCSWSDGTPTATGDQVAGGWWFRNNDNPGTAFGIAFPLAADTNTLRTVKFHCGRWGAAGTITVKLSDNSAPSYTHTSEVGWSTHNTFTIRYRAASAGQTLVIEWRNSGVVKDTDGNLQMIALTVSEEGDTPSAAPAAASPANSARASEATSASAPQNRAWSKSPVVPNKVSDTCQPVPYAAQRLDPQSYLGRRVDLNFRTGLLQTFDVDLYLDSYGQNPQWPSGEYLGKFMQGLSAMYLYTDEPAAKERLDKIIAAWRRVQAPDGWLGTTQRFKSWDIWEHKYVLLGLVDYHALTGDPAALEAARKIGDLYCATIGPGLGDIMHSGHWALGSASILEPMVYLYRYTGDPKYLRFCEYVVDAFESPTGPKLISTLTTGSKRVCDVEDPFANRAAREVKFSPTSAQVRNRSKGYEMLSCIIGLVRMYQLTGTPEYLAAARNAWQDITANRLYLAGSCGADECFKDDHCLPAETSDGPAEGCVTAHWIFLNRLLFEITGEARYADAVENALYNYLLASQRPQDCHQSYNTSMNGTKNFARHDATGKVKGAPCCISSVMREIARTPEMIWTKFATNGVGVVLFQKGWMEDTLKAAGGDSVSVRLEMDTDFPRSGEVTLRVRPQRVAKFRLALRVPTWAKSFKAAVGGQTREGTPGQFLNLEREWQPGDTVQITMDLNERLAPGGASYPGHFAFLRGPQVLTLVADKDAEGNLDRTVVKADAGAQLAPRNGFLPGGWIGEQAYTSPALLNAAGCALVPFGDAGQPGKPGRFQTWIKADAGSTPAKPTAPSGLQASASAGNRIRLSWTDNSRDEAGFRVERKRSDVGLWFHVKTTPSGVTACVDDAVNVVLPGKTYTYRVAAYHAGGKSAFASEATVTTPSIAVPAAPSDLKVAAVSPTQIKLVWTDKSDTEEGFRVECKIGASDKWIQVAGRVPANLSAFVDYGLDRGQTYAYRVRAFNAAGESHWCKEVTVQTPQAK